MEKVTASSITANLLTLTNLLWIAMGIIHTIRTAKIRISMRFVLIAGAHESFPRVPTIGVGSTGI